jgi:pimeloyl-ACP methyl ester carboxylesterase
MWDLVPAGAPPCDRSVYCAPRFGRPYWAALREGFAQGPEGYARDTVLAIGRWSIPLDRIQIPVDVWFGAEDATPSPDNGATLIARIPGARRHVVTGIGEAVLWTHAQPILRALLDRS